MQRDNTVCRMDYWPSRKTPVSPLYKAFQPCFGNPTGIPAARSGPSLHLGGDRRPRMSFLRATLSRLATFLYVRYPEDNTIKSPCV